MAQIPKAPWSSDDSAETAVALYLAFMLHGFFQGQGIPAPLDMARTCLQLARNKGWTPPEGGGNAETADV